METFTHHTWLKVAKFKKERNRRQVGKQYIGANRVGSQTSHFPGANATPKGALGMQAVPKSCLGQAPSLQHLTSTRPVKLDCLAMQAHRGNMFLLHIKLLCSFFIRGSSIKVRTHLNQIKLGHILSPTSLFCSLVQRYICADRKAYTTA